MAVLLAASCSLAFELDSLSDGQCPQGEKGCDGRCVSVFSPRTGCAQPSCAPCVLDNATANCDDKGECAIAACRGSYGNCDGEAATGCEIDLDHDPKHCGGCKAVECQTAHGTSGCSAHQCTIATCDDGFKDCNDEARDGCETDVTVAAQCEGCALGCQEAQACRSGACADDHARAR